MSTRTATDQFLQDCDQLDQDNGTQGGGDKSENDLDDADEDKGNKSDSDNDPIQGSGRGGDLGHSGGDGEGLRGSEEPGHRIDVDIDDRRSQGLEMLMTMMEVVMRKRTMGIDIWLMMRMMKRAMNL